MKYTYLFTIWPDETRGFKRSTFRIFRVFKWRAEIDMTQEEFELLREELEFDGLTLREIERRPFCPLEIVQ